MPGLVFAMHRQLVLQAGDADDLHQSWRRRHQAQRGPGLSGVPALVGADPGVDVVLALTTVTAGGDLVPEVGVARLPVPIAAAVLDQVEAVRLLPGPGEGFPAVPAYAYTESAARALGHAARYGSWRETPPGHVPDLQGVRQDRARELVASFLAEPSRGGWLPLDSTVELLGCYGVPLAGSTVVLDDLPQIGELELSPVIARPDGVQAVDGRIRLQAAEPADAHLRRLP